MSSNRKSARITIAFPLKEIYDGEVPLVLPKIKLPSEPSIQTVFVEAVPAVPSVESRKS